MIGLIVSHENTLPPRRRVGFGRRSVSRLRYTLAFLCLLEMIKNRLVMAVQESLFSPIQVWPHPETSQ